MSTRCAARLHRAQARRCRCPRCPRGIPRRRRGCGRRGRCRECSCGPRWGAKAACGRTTPIIAEAPGRRRLRPGRLSCAAMPPDMTGGWMQHWNPLRAAGDRRRWLPLALFACMAQGLAGGALAGPSSTDGADATTVYHGATLIDGTGAPPRQGLSIVVRDGRIAGVEPDATAPAGERVDMGGLYVLPKLINTHVHLATPPDAARAKTQLRRQLYSGITAVRSMADDLRSVAELSRQSLVGEIPAPDIVYAAL